jgi:hypothetical protein
MHDHLRDFISHARGKGMDHVTIRTLLLAAGWKDKEILAAIAAEGLELPVPKPTGGSYTTLTQQGVGHGTSLGRRALVVY